MQPSIQQQFFSQRNEVGILNSVAQQLGGVQMTEKQRTRLSKAVKHYMNEVWDTNGPMPVQQLNRDVIGVTAADFQTYLRREKAPSVNLQEYPDPRDNREIVGQLQYQAPPTQQLQYKPLPAQPYEYQQAQQQSMYPPPHQAPSYQPRAVPSQAASLVPTYAPLDQGLLMDTGTRFERLQQERTTNTAPTRPQVPDFQISMEDEHAPAALTLFEQAKKAREEEAARVKPAPSTPGAPAPVATQQTQEDTSNLLVRYITPTTLNDANANPTLAQPLVAVPRGPLPQDVLIRQEDVLTYRETEFNLILYSADRDWLNNSRETRYSFSVNFDVANNKHGFPLSPSATKKFKNITRIELVKAILPTEGLEPIVARASSAFDTTAKLNVLSFPYVVVRIPELDANNYGTDTHLDNAFGVLQYDANWYTDTTNLSDGFLGMIPKFMKCQKVYHPTPLATLTKLTIELQRPDGSLLSDISDTLSIQNIYFSGSTTAPPAAIVSANYRSVQDVNNNGDYIFIVSSTYFNQWAFVEGNRIQMKGLTASQVTGGSTAAVVDMIQYLERESGFVIVGIATTTIGDGANSAGYANVLVIRQFHNDPTTGSVLVKPFGGAASNATLASNLTSTTFTGAKLINLTHQTNLVLRVLTRDMDPTARVRPDNL